MPTEPCALTAPLAVLSRASTHPSVCGSATARAATGMGAAPHKAENRRTWFCVMMTSIALGLFLLGPDFGGWLTVSVAFVPVTKPYDAATESACVARFVLPAV